MDACLAKVKFPESADAYEFPDLVLPSTNPNAAAVAAAKVKRDWTSVELRPDYLTTRLDEPVVTLTKLEWDDASKRLSRGTLEPEQAELDLSAGGASYTSLVAASGAGKTRFLYEQGYKAFGAYVVAGKSGTQPGAEDLSSFLAELPRELPTTSLTVDGARTKLIDRMNRVILARTAVLRHAKQAFSGLSPRHWLALQLYPEKCVGSDVFRAAIDVSGSLQLSVDSVGVQWEQSGMRFLCIDEAQRADRIYAKKFLNEAKTELRSALSCLVTPLFGLKAHVVLAGTGLGIQSSWEMMVSGAAKHNIVPRLVGTTSSFDVSSLRAAVQARGYAGAVDDDTLNLFSGRPRFGMRLAEALVLGTGPKKAADDIMRELRELLGTLRFRPAESDEGSKTFYGEFRFAAMEWVLKGQGGVTRHGEVALEQGVCAISVMHVAGDASTFVIKEPLVVRAFADLADAEFEGITNESDANIGLMFENYVAFHAAELCAVLDDRRIMGNKAIKSRAEFQGPWKLADAAGDERRGMQCSDGEEPAALRKMLECARTQSRGIHLLFPGTAMGADLVVVARRADGRLLLLFVQLKACLKTSTPDAMRSLRLPYRQNRESASPSVPDGRVAAVKALDAEIFRDDVSVVLMVFKYPANSQSGYDRAKEATYTAYVDSVPAESPGRAQAPPATAARSKTVLELVVDSSNAAELLAGLRNGLKKMSDVKQVRARATT